MKNELTTIKKASLAKRIVSLIMDGAVTLFMFFAFFLFIFSPIASKGLGMNKAIEEGTKLQNESHLYVLVGEEKQSYYLLYDCEFDTYEEYIPYIKDYYVDFKANKAPDSNNKISVNNVEVLPKDYYTEAWFNTNIAPKITDKESAKKEAEVAINDLGVYLKPIMKKINLCKLFISSCSYTLSFGGFFILAPLLFKNGETLGKKTMGLCLLSKEGYTVKKRQVILRQLFLYVYVGAFTLYVGIGFTSFALLGLGVFIYFIVAFISKTNRSFADFIAFTQVIDAKNSVWFKDAKEEEKKQQILETNLKKYNDVDTKNKNVIQVGSEIVDENVKKEFLDSKAKSSSKKD